MAAITYKLRDTDIPKIMKKDLEKSFSYIISHKKDTCEKIAETAFGGAIMALERWVRFNNGGSCSYMFHDVSGNNDFGIITLNTKSDILDPYNVIWEYPGSYGYTSDMRLGDEEVFPYFKRYAAKKFEMGFAGEAIAGLFESLFRSFNQYLCNQMNSELDVDIKIRLDGVFDLTAELVDEKLDRNIIIDPVFKHQVAKLFE